MLSLKQSLKKINYPKLGKSIPAIPNGFHSFPRSLKSAMHSMNPPLIDSWYPMFESKFENREWTEECQGITSDGQSFYVVKNKNADNDWDIRAVYKFSRKFKLLQRTIYPDIHHIGSPDYYNGKIYVPIDGTTSIWILDTNLFDKGIFELGKNKDGQLLQQASVPWCAINPWNGLLYSSKFGEEPYYDENFTMVDNDPVTEIHCYDPDKKFEYKETLKLSGEPLHRVQGGYFSKNGHLYLLSDFTEDISAYSALDGSFLGSVNVPYDRSPWPGEAEEAESIWMDHWMHGEISSYIHVMILDNDANPDDVFLKHYVVPDPTVI